MVVFLFGWVSNLTAEQGEGQERKVLDRIVEANIRNLKGPMSLQYSGVEVSRATPEVPPPLLQYLPSKAQVKYQSAAKKYRLEVQTSSPVFAAAHAVAFDGSHWQYLGDNGERLSVSKRESRSFPLYTHNLLFRPLGELLFGAESRATPSGDAYYRTLLDYQNRAIWERTMASVTAAGEGPFENYEATVRVTRPYPQLPEGKPQTLETYFSIADDYAPVGWRLIDDASEVRAVFVVTELMKIQLKDRAGEFICMKKGELRSVHGGVVSIIGTTEITDISVDEPIDANAFTIDPGRARTIHDKDDDTYIAVPAP